jgi:DNA ligase 1
MNCTLPRRRLVVASLASLVMPAWARSAKRLPLVLAQNAAPDIDPTGWLVSEKLDGVRAYWDGSSLWFRSGLPVAAPGWFTASRRWCRRCASSSRWMPSGVRCV